ncbi:hypothetical protein DWY22_04775 [Heyndrickxia coagulans]|nr:hypothetical protein DWY22_04775 [Heyndrickxia coagulans]RGR99504.1 hypothetical protein DWY16_04930 [Heyndrickxia coagulans]
MGCSGSNRSSFSCFDIWSWKIAAALRFSSREMLGFFAMFARFPSAIVFALNMLPLDAKKFVFRMFLL